MKKIYFFINIFRISIAWVIIKSCKQKDLIIKDLTAWKSLLSLKGGMFFSFGILLQKKEYRSLVYSRIKNGNLMLSMIFRMLYSPMNTLFIITNDIGEGLFIQHGFSTIIAAKSIGKNCYINQQVTIGYEGDKNPIIGNNVRICCGAKIIGGVSIGDNSIIGANAVVVKDVPSDVTVGGVPAKIIRYHTSKE